MLRIHQQLIGLRRRHPWLVRATTTTTQLTNTRYAYTAHPATGPGALRVELDVTDGHHALVRDDTGAVLFSYDS